MSALLKSNPRKNADSRRSPRPAASTPSLSQWLGKNGDWVVYASQCHKQDWRVYDIFVGRACDGKWYYSSYHFCIEMINLTVNGQPSALPAFVEQYYLSQFDGKSDEALQKTWPPSADP